MFFLSFFSSLLFLRVGYVIGNAGLLYGLLQLFISYVILCCTVCSISAIATNGSVKGHSIYIRTESLYCLLSALMNWFIGRLGRATCTVKSRSSKNPGLDKSNLPQISNFGREFVEKSGVQIPVKEGQIFLPLFLFIFKFSIKNCISLFLTIFEYLVLQIRYQ